MIHFSCPICKSVLQSPDPTARSKTVCPQCGQRLLIPNPVKPKSDIAARLLSLMLALAVLGVLGWLIWMFPNATPQPNGDTSPDDEQLANLAQINPLPLVQEVESSHGDVSAPLSSRIPPPPAPPPAAKKRPTDPPPTFESRPPELPSPVRPAADTTKKKRPPPSTEKGEADLLGQELVEAASEKQEGLLEKLRQGKGPEYTQALAVVIGQLPDEAKKKARQTLADRLTRFTAKTLLAYLGDENPELRRAAALALGMKADKEHIGALKEMLKDPDSLVVRAAQTALKNLKEDDAAAEEQSKALAIVEGRLRAGESELRKQLLDVPELRLVNDLEVQAFLKSTNVRSTNADRNSATAVLHQTLVQAGLNAGLNLRGGAQARLQLSAALVVEELSKSLRDMGFVSGVPSPGSRRGLSVSQQNKPLETIEEFQKWCDDKQIEKANAALPTLLQMLQVEESPLRLLLVRELSKVNNRDTTIVLTKRALFDLDPEVRDLAVKSLEKRSSNQYLPFLLQALRYPWPPVADHAAYALRKLKTPGIEPWLIDLLEKPNPSVPVLDKRSKKLLVPELVRLNHMRNCLLCHPPSINSKDGLVRGLSPTPGEPLPSGGYAGQSGNFVRADTTFLRQDFSVIMTVEGAAPWPSEQRFDFVVRTRVVKPDEMPDIASKSKVGEAPGIASKTKPEEMPGIASKSKVPEMPAIATKTDGNYPQREAVLYALRGLTGKDAGTSAEKWREMLAITKNAPKGLGSDTQRKTTANKTPTPGQAVTTKKGNGQ